jgi:hypothetical protein
MIPPLHEACGEFKLLQLLLQAAALQCADVRLQLLIELIKA